MGLLAEFIVATEEDATAYDGDPSFPDSHKALYKRFTELELGTLYHIAQGEEVDDETFYDFNVIRTEDGGERVTTELIPDLVSRLAAASDSELESWATRWSRTEEVQCASAEILPVLADLRRLSKLAVSESKSMYLWNCM